MGQKAHNVGLILAILAGILACTNAIWPITPHGYNAPSHLATIWMLGSFLVGVAFLVAAFLSQDHADAAKVVLYVGGLLLIGSGLYFGDLIGIGAAIFDFVPGILAIVAGFLIGPVGAPIPTDHS